MNTQTEFKKIITELLKRRPIIHHINNYVTAGYCADIALAAGASPIMAEDPREMQDITGGADALVLNLGMLSEMKERAMREAARTAKEKNIPVVLDPVGVMSSTLRLDFALELLRSKSITAVRCNQAEAQALLDERGGGRGLDAAGGDDPKCMRLAQELARKYNITVAITGATDYVSDGKRALALQGGNPLLKRITGSGCMTTTLVACCCAVGTDMLVATALALVIMGQAAEVAAGLLEAKDGPGMFRARMSDCVYHVVTKWDAINSALSADKIQ